MTPGSTAIYEANLGVLKACALSKSFAKKEVVRKVDLEVCAGEIVGLLGPNGAGKTTTFRMMVGLIKPNLGQVFLDGRDITGMAMYQRANRGVGYLPQEPTIFRKLSVLDNLNVALESRGMPKKERQSRAEALLNEFSLYHLRRSQAVTLSGGERRRLEIARAMATEPRFLLLDEPFTGLDPIMVGEVKSQLLPLTREQGIGILITDHSAREMLEICNRLILLYDGAVVCKGTPEEIVQNTRAREVYLGDGFNLN